MEILQGIGVSPGVAIGPVFILGREETVIIDRKVTASEIKNEIGRFHDAMKETILNLERIRDAVSRKVLPKHTAIFDAHIAILRDPVLTDEVIAFIRERSVVAEHAVSRVFRKYIVTLEQIEDEYLSQRADDLRDIQRRIISSLAGTTTRGVENIDRAVILISRYLSPAETATLSKDKVMGLATDMGGLTSHTSILARAFEIPAVVGLKTVSHHVSSGDVLIVDGTHGRVIISPDRRTLEQYKLLQRDIVFSRYVAELDKSEPALSSDKKYCKVMANVDNAESVVKAMDNGADGVGLFRTEYLVLEKGTQPTEEEQYYAYLKAIEAVEEKVITFRTFDIGSDKLPKGYLHREENNPALGVRALRLAKLMPEILNTQLRAILRAAATVSRKNGRFECNNVRIMFPMIAHLHEFRWAKGQVKRTTEDLKSKDVFVPRGIKIGAMLEIPSILLASGDLVREADFLSIGTNDLIQYLFAVDRTNENVSELFSPAHLAVFKLIEQFIAEAKIPGLEHKLEHLSVCGEIASDPFLLLLLLGLGIKTISVSIPSIPTVKHEIRSVSLKECHSLAISILANKEAEIEIEPLREYLNEKMLGEFA